MNNEAMHEGALTPEDQILLDRLVDGEVTETERRELLLRLERSPEGWRRCALAFLEAQAWRGEARAMATEPAYAATAPKLRPAAPARAAWGGLGIWLPIATAAGFLLALGYVNWFASTPGVDPSDPQNLRILAGQRIPDTDSASPEDSRRAAGGGDNLRLVVAPGPGGQRQVVDVPLVEAGRMQEALFGPMAQQLPPEVVRMLEQQGNQVVRERRLVPIDLQDGRRVVVPMEQVEIRPVGMQAFQ